MAYQFDFSSLTGSWDLIARGIGQTAALTMISAVAGLAIGILGAWARWRRVPVLSAVIAVYVEFIRNTPFLVQLFFLFFGLPALGLRLGEFQAAALAMVVNLGAYSVEIVRAGLQSVGRGQIEAAASLAMSPAQTFRHVVLVPALGKMWPALTSQVVIVMLGSSVCSQIAAEELTFAASTIQSRNFRAFEVYFLVTLLYLLLSVGLRRALVLVGSLLLERRRHV